MVIIRFIPYIFVLGFLACSSSGFRSQPLYRATNNLQRYCRSHKIVSEETKLADSLISQSFSLIKKKEYEDAYWHSEIAAGYYKIAITRKTLDHSTNDLNKLKTTLADDIEHLSSLQEVYDEIKSLKRQ